MLLLTVYVTLYCTGVSSEAVKASSLAAAASLFDAPADNAHEPEEEGRGLKILHALVGDLAADMKELAAEIKALTDKVLRLEKAQ